MSTGQILGGGVGAVVGAILAAPTGGLSLAGGALLGAQVGMAAGGYLDPPKGPTIYGPRLGDRSVQTSTYGTILTRYYGTISAHGNATWLENNQLKESVRKKKSGGKGGGSVSTVKTYTYSATFFLSLGEGEIAGIRRMWCQDKLIYNAGSDDLETIIASNQAASGWKLYRGTDDQLPDPRYEADVGVGNASAYRGEAYIAFYDFQLADFGNSLQGAQFKVEVVTQQVDGWSRQLIRQGASPWPFVSAGMNGLSATYFTWKDYNQEAPNNLLYVNTITDGAFEQVKTFFDVGAFAPFPSTMLVGQTDVPLCVFFSGTSFIAYDADGIRLSGSAPGSLGARPAFSQRDGHEYFCNFGGNGFYRTTNGQAGIMVSTGHPYHAVGIGETKLFCLRTASGVQTSMTIDVFDKSTLAPIETLTESFTNASPVLYVESDSVFYTTGSGNLYRWENGVASLFATEVPEVYAGDASLALQVIERKISTFNFADDKRFELTYDNPTVNLVPLADIVENEIELSSLLTAADVDTSLLAAQVRGYRVSGGSIRSALEPPQGIWPFDMIQSGYRLKPVPRGQASVMTIPWQDLGASEGDAPGDLLQESREMDSQLPARTSIKYLDAAREYAIAEQSAARDNTPAINRVDRELPIVLTADEAAGVADVLQNLAWEERSEYAFSLPPTYLALEPADVVTIVAPWATFELRLTEINYAPSGRLECKARPNRAALYTSNAKGGEGVPPIGTIPLPGSTLLLLLDIPVIDETLQNTPGFVSLAAGYTDGWPGAVAFRSIDSGQTWNELQGYSGIPSMGYARETLPASSGAVIDQRTLVVDLLAGEMESITRDQMINGQNYAAYGADGRWEIVRFQNAALQPDGSYLLSQFVRGDRGTEWATALHQAGDTFVLLDDPDNTFIDMAVGSIGVPATYRGVTSGASIDGAADVPFTYQGVNLECLSPVSAQGARDTSGNFSGRFVRRSRLSSSWWTTGVPAPVGETSEAYEIDVMSGSTVKRTITASTPAFNYSAANQVSDFGSTQAAITFRIYQLSGVVGRGIPLEVTL